MSELVRGGGMRVRASTSLADYICQIIVGLIQIRPLRGGMVPDGTGGLHKG